MSIRDISVTDRSSVCWTCTWQCPLPWLAQRAAVSSCVLEKTWPPPRVEDPPILPHHTRGWWWTPRWTGGSWPGRCRTPTLVSMRSLWTFDAGWTPGAPSRSCSWLCVMTRNWCRCCLKSEGSVDLLPSPCCPCDHPGRAPPSSSAPRSPSAAGFSGTECKPRGLIWGWMKRSGWPTSRCGSQASPQQTHRQGHTAGWRRFAPVR